jgi:hypothetical protein
MTALNNPTTLMPGCHVQDSVTKQGIQLKVPNNFQCCRIRWPLCRIQHDAVGPWDGRVVEFGAEFVQTFQRRDLPSLYAVRVAYASYDVVLGAVKEGG